MDDESIPLSQLANEAFNPTAPHCLDASASASALPGVAVGPTDFRGLAASLANGADGAGPGPGSGRAPPARIGKSGKLLQDPIHGCFRLDPACALIFDTRWVRRQGWQALRRQAAEEGEEQKERKAAPM